MTPEVIDRLEDYATVFRDDFFPQHKKRTLWGSVYLQGLLQDGERKSIEPLSERVILPLDLTAKDPEQALQQFVNQSPWDEQGLAKRYRRHLAETFAELAGGICGLPEQPTASQAGKHSVGVQRQYCGALGPRAGQVAPSVHYVSPWAITRWRCGLFLPDCWIEDRGRLKRAGVPEAMR